LISLGFLSQAISWAEAFDRENPPLIPTFLRNISGKIVIKVAE
jgi:hypothetical protein